MKMLILVVWIALLVAHGKAARTESPIVLCTLRFDEAFDLNKCLQSACASLLDHLIAEARVRAGPLNGRELRSGGIDMKKLTARKADREEAMRIPPEVDYVVVTPETIGIRVGFFWRDNMYSYVCVIDRETFQALETSDNSKLRSALLLPKSEEDPRGPRVWEYYDENTLSRVGKKRPL